MSARRCAKEENPDLIILDLMLPKMGEEAGADAYITKPFDHPALLAKIGELLKERV